MGSCTSKKKPKGSVKSNQNPNSESKPEISSSVLNPNETLTNFPTFYYLERSKGTLYLISKASIIEYPIKTSTPFLQESSMAYLSIESIFLVGGTQNTTISTSVLSISISNKQAVSHTPLPMPCKQGQLHEYNSFVYYIGGLTPGTTVLKQAPLMAYSLKLDKWEILSIQDQQCGKILNMGSCVLGHKLLIVGGQRAASNGELRNSKNIYSISLNEGFKVKLEAKLPVKIIRANIAAGVRNAVLSGGICAKSGKVNRASFVIKSERDRYEVVRIKDVGIDLAEKYPATYHGDTALFISFPFIAVKMKKLAGWIGFKITGKETREMMNFDSLQESKVEEESSDDSLAKEKKKVIRCVQGNDGEKILSMFVRKNEERKKEAINEDEVNGEVGKGKENEDRERIEEKESLGRENLERKRENDGNEEKNIEEMKNEVIKDDMNELDSIRKNQISSFASNFAESGESSSSDLSKISVIKNPLENKDTQSSPDSPGKTPNPTTQGKILNPAEMLKKIAVDMPELFDSSESSSPNFSQGSPLFQVFKGPTSIPKPPSTVSPPLPDASTQPVLNKSPEKEIPQTFPAPQTTNLTNTLSISSSSCSDSLKFTVSDSRTIELNTMSSKQFPILEVEEKVKNFQFVDNKNEEIDVQGVIDQDFQFKQQGVRVLTPPGQGVRILTSANNTQFKMPTIPKLKLEKSLKLEETITRPKTVEIIRNSGKSLRLRPIQPYITTRTFGADVNLLGIVDKTTMTISSPRTDRSHHNYDFGEHYEKAISSRPEVDLLKDLSKKKVRFLSPVAKVKIKKTVFFKQDNIQKLLDIVSNEFKKPRILSPPIKTPNYLLKLLQSILPMTYSLQNLNNILLGIPLIFNKSDFTPHQLTFIITRSQLQSSQSPSPAQFTQAIYKAYKVALLKSH